LGEGRVPRGRAVEGDVVTAQLRKLATPFPDHLVEQKPGTSAADYVAHPIVEQALIATLRQVPRQEVVMVIRGHAAEIVTQKRTYPAVDNAITGVVLRLSCVIDGVETVVEEAGDVEAPAMKDTDGARLKDAVSDAYKRCAMRMGLGLHLWAREHYFLDQSLEKSADQ